MKKKRDVNIFQDNLGFKQRVAEDHGMDSWTECWIIS